MNLLFGEDFNTLKFRAKHLYNAKDLRYSNRRNKKICCDSQNGKNIHFGDRMHEDPERRLRYRKRASKIKNKYGKLTYKDPKYANYWSYHLLW